MAGQSSCFLKLCDLPLFAGQIEKFLETVHYLMKRTYHRLCYSINYEKLTAARKKMLYKIYLHILALVLATDDA